MATNILQNLRRAVAQKIGPFGVFTATAGSPSTATCVAAFKSTELNSGSLAYDWFYVPGATGVAQRRVKKDGVATGSGVITLDDVLTTAVANGTVFELLSRLPASQAAAGVGNAMVMGIHECINEALKRLLVTRIVTVSVSAGDRDVSLASIVGVDRKERVIEVRQLNADGTGREPTWRRWEYRDNVEGPSIYFPQGWETATSLHVECRVPAFNYIQVASVWGSSTVGLVNESDACGSDADSIDTGALAFAYQAIRDTSYGADRARFAELADVQMERFKKVRDYIHEVDTPPPAPTTIQTRAAA